MMSSVGHARATLSHTEVAGAGAASGVITRLFCQPLDVAKIRLQLQSEGGGGKYRGLAHLAATLPREEGLLALWKGHLPAQALSVLYGLASFAMFEAVSPMVRGEGTCSRLGGDLVAGGMAGCAGTLASAPCDVLRTRFVAQAKPVYRNTRHAVTQLYREGGPAAFYRGVTPAMLATAPQAGLQFAFYSLFTSLLPQDSPGISLPESLTCGGLAGLVSKALLYPLDVLKKRIQVSGWEGREGLGRTRAVRGLTHCARDLLAREGARGLYKGFAPAVIKAVTTTSIHFAAYEHLCLLLSLRQRS